MNIENKQFFQDEQLIRVVPAERYEMKPDEQHYITKELTKVKLDDDIGEIWTYPALHLFHGKISEKIVKDVIEHCTNTNNDDASGKLVAYQHTDFTGTITNGVYTASKDFLNQRTLVQLCGMLNNESVLCDQSEIYDTTNNRNIAK